MKLDEQDSNKALDLFIKNLMQANTDANPTLGFDDVEDEKKTKNIPEKSYSYIKSILPQKYIEL